MQMVLNFKNIWIFVLLLKMLVTFWTSRLHLPINMESITNPTSLCSWLNPWPPPSKAFSTKCAANNLLPALTAK